MIAWEASLLRLSLLLRVASLPIKSLERVLNERRSPATYTLPDVLRRTWPLILYAPLFFFPYIIHLPALCASTYGAGLVHSEAETQAQHKLFFGFAGAIVSYLFILTGMISSYGVMLGTMTAFYLIWICLYIWTGSLDHVMMLAHDCATSIWLFRSQFVPPYTESEVNQLDEQFRAHDAVITSYENGRTRDLEKRLGWRINDMRVADAILKQREVCLRDWQAVADSCPEIRKFCQEYEVQYHESA